MRRDPNVASAITSTATSTVLPTSAGRGNSVFVSMGKIAAAAMLGASAIELTTAVRSPVLGNTIVRKKTKKHVHRMFAVIAIARSYAMRIDAAKMPPDSDA